MLFSDWLTLVKHDSSSAYISCRRRLGSCIRIHKRIENIDEIIRACASTCVAPPASYLVETVRVRIGDGEDRVRTGEARWVPLLGQ